MVYCFLPGNGIYGGIKMAYQFVDLLNELGVPAVVATPGARAATWFESHAPVVDREAALAGLTEEDVVLFSLPHDFGVLANVPGRLVFHCLGTDPLIDPILIDDGVTHLSCWEQAAAYIESHSGRVPLDVGLMISNAFYYDGRTPKQAGRVAFMPRRGREIAERCAAKNAGLHFQGIDGKNEAAVASALHQSEYYLATAEGEWFGLPALEAMAAGCIVLSVETVGGGEYLIDGETCLMCSGDEMPGRLAWVTRDEQVGLRHRLRHAALAMAYRYRGAAQKRKVRKALTGALGGVLA